MACADTDVGTYINKSFDLSDLNFDGRHVFIAKATTSLTKLVFLNSFDVSEGLFRCCYQPGVAFAKLYFLLNLRIGWISWGLYYKTFTDVIYGFSY
jgi:hypothetical protein